MNLGRALCVPSNLIQEYPIEGIDQGNLTDEYVVHDYLIHDYLTQEP